MNKNKKKNKHQAEREERKTTNSAVGSRRKMERKEKNESSALENWRVKGNGMKRKQRAKEYEALKVMGKVKTMKEVSRGKQAEAVT